MRIPFIRLFPGGASAIQPISRGKETERLAHIFLRSGGRYFINIHPNGEVELVAAVELPFPARVAEAWCRNDPALPQAVDQLVVDSIDRMGAPSVLIH
jgi:hypothetical protein